jgi:hypothetical protein
MEFTTQKPKPIETNPKESNDNYNAIESLKRKIYDNRWLRANCKSIASKKV